MRRFAAHALLLTGSLTIAACSGGGGGARSGSLTTSTDFEPTADKVGGQPGELTLRGGLITAAGAPLPALRVREQAGHNLAGQPAATAPSQSYSTELTPNDLKEIGLAKSLGTYVQFGCGSGYADAAGLKPRAIDTTKPKIFVRAKVAIFCGPISFDAMDVHVAAERVVFDDARVALSGGREVRFTVIANEISFNNESTIDAKGRDNAAPRGAPGVTLVANHVLGTGTIYLNAEGSDWVPRQSIKPAVVQPAPTTAVSPAPAH